MTFRVISVGWDCAQWVQHTLSSIEMQTNQDYTVHVVDDTTEDPEQLLAIAEWCDPRDERWTYTFNTERKYALYNQITGIRSMNPDPSDIIVFLDLDGDRLADPGVFDLLQQYYDSGVDLTYGNYRPIPNMGTSSFPVPFPDSVVANCSYREHTLSIGCCFNHLRTVRYSILSQIPDSEFKHTDGTWFEAAPDFAVMIPCLELANGNYHCFKQVLLDYNHAQPHPEHKNPSQTNAVNGLLKARGNFRNRKKS